MNRLTEFLAIVFITAACSSNQTKKGPSQINNQQDNSEIQGLSKPVLKKQVIAQLVNSIWTHEPFPNCIDTLRLGVNRGTFYMCEHELNYPVDFNIESDTLYLNKYGLKSEVNDSEGFEIKSKYKFIKSDNKLIIVEIGRRYQDKFKPDDEQFLYKEYELMKN